MEKAQILHLLRACNQIALDAVAAGHHPFGAMLVAPDGEEILLKQGNVDTVRHAESELARAAAQKFPADFLWGCTLVTTLEPCAMCAGTLYWANIGKLVYGVAESKLLELTGNDERNPTLSLPSRTVLSSGQKAIEVHGPFAEVEAEILSPHAAFWNRH